MSLYDILEEHRNIFCNDNSGLFAHTFPAFCVRDSDKMEKQIDLAVESYAHERGKKSYDGEFIILFRRPLGGGRQGMFVTDEALYYNDQNDESGKIRIKNITSLRVGVGSNFLINRTVIRVGIDDKKAKLFARCLIQHICEINGLEPPDFKYSGDWQIPSKESQPKPEIDQIGVVA